MKNKFGLLKHLNFFTETKGVYQYWLSDTKIDNKIYSRLKKNKKKT
jgi:hypothetical protein